MNQASVGKSLLFGTYDPLIPDELKREVQKQKSKTILGSAYLSIKQQAEFYRIVIHINVGIECLILLKTFKYLKENG